MIKYTSHIPYSFHSYVIEILDKENLKISIDETCEDISICKNFKSKIPKNTLVSVLMRSKYITRFSKVMHKLKKYYMIQYFSV